LLTADEKLRLELQLALLTGNASEADRLSNQLLISQARTTGLANFIANLPKALNPFADYPAYVQAALAELSKLAAGQKSLQTSPMKTDQEIRLEQLRAVTQNAVTRTQEIYDSLMAKIAAKTKDNSPVVNVQVEVGGQQLTDIVTNTQINNSASGIQSKLNRLNLID
jgi:hypothetical protein